MQSAASHTANVMAAVRQRIQTLNDDYFQATPITVEIGNPAQFHPRAEAAGPLVTVFVYRLQLDGAAIHTTPNTAQAVQLHTLITAVCPTGATQEESAGTFELRILSHIIRLFMEDPGIGPVRIPNALPLGPAAPIVMADLMVEARHRPLEVEDMNHIWTTQGDAPYRTSIAYTFAFGVITPSRPTDDGPPVITPVLEDPDDDAMHPIGVSPTYGQDAPDADVPPDRGVLLLQLGNALDPNLVPDASFTAGGGDVVLQVVAITETAEALTLSLEAWDAAATGWVDASARLGSTAITTQRRMSLQAGDPIAPVTITLSDDGTPALLRLVASRPAVSPPLDISRVTLTMEAP